MSLKVLFRQISFLPLENGTQHRAAIVLTDTFTQRLFISTKEMSWGLRFWHAENLMHDKLGSHQCSCVSMCTSSQPI